MSNYNGGPAFPILKKWQADEYGKAANTGYEASVIDEGMSLRDYFAAKAMQGYLNECYDMDHTSRARFSYDLADAMLKARQQ